MTESIPIIYLFPLFHLSHNHINPTTTSIRLLHPSHYRIYPTTTSIPLLHISQYRIYSPMVCIPLPQLSNYYKYPTTASTPQTHPSHSWLYPTTPSIQLLTQSHYPTTTSVLILSLSLSLSTTLSILLRHLSQYWLSHFYIQSNAKSLLPPHQSDYRIFPINVTILILHLFHYSMYDIRRHFPLIPVCYYCIYFTTFFISIFCT